MSGSEDFDVIQEWSWDDFLVLDKKNGQTSPVLCPVSDSIINGEGYCRFYACGDVLNTRRALLETTRPSSDYDYIGGTFGDKYSTQQLIHKGDEKLEQIFFFAGKQGTSEIHYEHLAKNVPGQSLKNTLGCLSLGCDRYKYFSGGTLFEEICVELEEHGPLVGSFACNLDFERIRDDYIYVSSVPSDFLYFDNGKKQSHAIMIVGNGIAYQKSCRKNIAYCIFQNNWGAFGNRIGRIPAEYIVEACAPIFDKQCNLKKFIKEGGNENYQLVERAT